MSHNLEQEWARYKYWVMSRSQAAYLQLREMFKNKDVTSHDTLDSKNSLSEENFYKVIEGIRDVKDDKAELNTFQHVWGYFKKQCTSSELNEFLALSEVYAKEGSNREEVLEFLWNLTQKYDVKYLKESYYFEELKETK